MGWFTGVIVQAVVTSVVLGALKRAGIVRVEPLAIDNDSAREMFMNAVNFGETIATRAEILLGEFKKK